MGTKRTNDGQVKEKKKNDKKRALNDEDQVSKAIEDDVEGENPDLGGDVVKEEQEEEVEVEAISHAEQRKRRKLEKKKLAEAAANGVDGTDEVETDSKKLPTSAVTAKKADSKASDKESRSGFGVWVGNLAFRTDAAKLREFFSSKMQSATITRVNMPQGPKDRSGQLQPNKGFAYIDFSTQDQVTDAVALSEDHLDGRRLLIKDAKSYEGRPVSAARAAVESGEVVTAEPVAAETKSPAKAAASTTASAVSLSKTAKRILDKQKNRPTPCLFVGNLGFESTAEMVQAAFARGYKAQSQWAKKETRERKAKAGKTDATAENESDADDSEDDENAAQSADARDDKENHAVKAGIRKVRLGTFEDSGKCKGWAFVDFVTTAQATAALINQRNHYLNGRTLTVEYATADAVKRGGGSLSQDQHHKLPKLGKAKYDPVARKEQKERIRAIKSQGFSSSNSIPIAASKIPLVNSDGKPHKPNKEERAALRAEREALKSKGGRNNRGARGVPDRIPEAIVRTDDGQAVKGQKVVFE